MPAKVILQVVAALVVAAMFLSTGLRGHAPQTLVEWLAPITPAVTVAFAGLWLFDRFIWRWPLVRRLTGRPVLDGTWHGELASDWVNPQTDQRIPADPDVFLVVRQSFWRISVRMYTKESKSASLLAALKTADDGVHELVYVFANKPRPDVRHRSAQHYGTVVLGVPRHRSEGFEGEYFTGRGTGGEMRFRRHFKGYIESHARGQELVRSGATTEAKPTPPADAPSTNG